MYFYNKMKTCELTCESTRFCCNRMMQPNFRFLRDVRVHQILEGTNEVMRMIIARNVLTRD